MTLLIGFDLDGTLVDSVCPHFMAINFLLLKYEKQPIKDLSAFRELNVDFRKFYQEMGIQASIEELDKLYQPCFRMFVGEWMPALSQSVKEVLSFLRPYARLVLVTAQQAEIIQLYSVYSDFNIFEFFGQDNAFLVQNSESKESILRAIRQERSDQDNIYIYISDTPDDLIGAQKAGWKVYGIINGFSSKENLEKAIAKGNGGIIQDILELKSMFL